MITPILLTVAFAYVLGSLPFGYWVAKRKGVNILEVGSKNPGATNVKRVLGKGPGNVVFALDVCKGIFATITPLIVFPIVLGDSARSGTFLYDLGGVAGVVGAVLGHSFSCFLGFRGGKGVATAAGGLLMLMPLPCLVAAVAWVVTFFASRFVSLASIVAAAIIAITPWFLSFGMTLNVMATLLGLLVIVRHHANISRLMAGTEHRWDRK
ncbi:glycerol-3-phosphate 1-O-acyltransferase PlsY [Actomonas aquatica]|uniref:Glycerol-3-phosphate acyltransferase n=1 Tax=Actomonas aquatica TaxID=2866162 RepID=A0ABZ1CBW0_9BACT|nr:glycerol-3-phosphate 1-O-acyltransferase PlsY [Opitutus sp. WL0086]WRQ88936.1 glycerol-3-phosphate 1-O-acyltransferase PlsY [Opitutus sp. WL0086]